MKRLFERKQRFLNIQKLSVGVLCLLGVFMETNAYAAPDLNLLTLTEAEQLAVRREPELQRIQANAAALDQQAIADAQLADPQLMLGTINVPTDTFSFTQDEMTMVEIGLQQTFSPGNSRAIKSRQTKTMAQAERFTLQEQKLALMRNVRDTWLNLHYWTEASKVTKKSRALFAELLKTVKSQYSAGKGNLADVSQAELDLSRLDDQSLQITQQIAMLQAQLGRWISPTQAQRSVASSLPQWSQPPPLAVFEAQLHNHPLLQMNTANVKVARDEVAFAKEQYKPSIDTALSYGIRQGEMNGTPRSNMVTAQVSVDLPVFRGQRQDRRLQADRYRLEASELKKEANYRDLLQELQTQYAIWQQLSNRASLYQKKLVPEARQNAKATLLAYQNTASDLATVLRAYTNAFSAELEQLQIQVERAKARAALLYLEGRLS